MGNIPVVAIGAWNINRCEYWIWFNGFALVEARNIPMAFVQIVNCFFYVKCIYMSKHLLGRFAFCNFTQSVSWPWYVARSHNRGTSCKYGSGVPPLTFDTTLIGLQLLRQINFWRNFRVLQYLFFIFFLYFC